MQIECPLAVVEPLEAYSRPPGHIALGLQGPFQRKNASIAIQLCRAFDARIASPQVSAPVHAAAAAAARCAELDNGTLPDTYRDGLASCTLYGRAQVAVVSAEAIPEDLQDTGPSVGPSGDAAAVDITFFLDGAHSPESCAVCADWFAGASGAAADALEGAPVDTVLLFNCGNTRQPSVLLEPFSRCLESSGRGFQHAVFAPADSTYPRSPRKDGMPDVSWQLSIADAWEELTAQRTAAPEHGEGSDRAQAILGAACFRESTFAVFLLDVARGASARFSHRCSRADGGVVVAGKQAARSHAGTSVHYSLPTAMARVREFVLTRHAQGRRVQVLVTGSLHLVGDVMQLLGIPPEYGAQGSHAAGPIREHAAQCRA